MFEVKLMIRQIKIYQALLVINKLHAYHEYLYVSLRKYFCVLYLPCYHVLFFVVTG